MKPIGSVYWQVLASIFVLATSRESQAQICTQPFLFDPPVSAVVGPNPTDIVTGDFNGDGFADLAVGNIDLAHAGAGSSVSIFLGTGTRTFASPVHYPVLADPMGLATGDFNEDGITDLVVSSTVNRVVSVLLGQGTGAIGDGSFAPAVTYPAGAKAFHVVVADFNRDGILDLAVSSDSAPAVRVFGGNGSEGVGDGTFAGPVAFPLASVSTGIVSDDLNHDDVPDLALTENLNGTVAILLGTGVPTINPGSFAPALHYSAGTPFDLSVEDFDDDGNRDLAVGGATGVVVLKGDGSGGFTTLTSINSGNTATVVPFDANRDGIEDLAVAHVTGSDGGLVRLYLGQGTAGAGNGMFGNESTYSIGADPYQLAITRFDADGRLDLVASAYYQDFVSVLPGACRADPRFPALTDVRDVPNDNGGFVFVTWTASSLDVSGGSVINYRVWRRIPPASALMLKTVGRADNRVMEMRVVRADGTEEIVYWEALVTLPAQRLAGYGYTAPTTQDSMRASNPHTAFFVTALTGNIEVFYSSNVDSGYSVDNIRPRRPGDFRAATADVGILLTWEANVEPDLDGYRLHRSTIADFVPSEDNLIAAPASEEYEDIDGGAGFCYKLLAIDTHGNESPAAIVDLSNNVGVEDPSTPAFALHGARPNPSVGGSMAVHFSLARTVPGQLLVLDLAGRTVFSRSIDGFGPGNHVIVVGGRERLAPGVYLLKLRQGVHVREAKSIVLK